MSSPRLPPIKPAATASAEEKAEFDRELLDYYAWYEALPAEEKAAVTAAIAQQNRTFHRTLFTPQGGQTSASAIIRSRMGRENISPGDDDHTQNANVNTTPGLPRTVVNPSPTISTSVFGVPVTVTNESVATGSEMLAIKEHIRRLAEDFEEGVAAPYTEQLTELAKLSAYAGLNVEKMRQQIVKNAREVNAGHPEEPIMVAICIGLIRGNNVTRMKTTSKEQLMGFLTMLTDKLRVVDKVSKRSDAITLTRVCICFPELTATVASVIKAPGVVYEVPENYPWCMRNSSFSGLIPRTASNSARKNEYELLRKCQILYQARTTIQLAGLGKAPKLDKNLLERQKTFVHTGIQQSNLTDEKRERAINRADYGIYTNGVLNQAILQQAKDFDDIYNKL